ncbi:hypothetical protein B0H11DRAFT_2218214 [Mycena galericulata]|nr:hypothetical protein B0H11DRAFT_2218214 [Mycena galericulata]
MPPKKGKDGPGLNFIFFLVSAVPPAILATFDDDPEPGEEDYRCLFILALKRPNFLPLWKEVCPLEHEKKWGPDWERLRAQICCLGDEMSGYRNVLALKWEADALSTLAHPRLGVVIEGSEDGGRDGGHEEKNEVKPRPILSFLWGHGE